MAQRVAIIGIGHTAFSSVSPAVSYREMIYEAANKAYGDAGIDPRRDVESFVAVSEDFQEGTSIFDEYTPDQLGAAMRPVHTIAADAIHGLITGYMLILSGVAKVVAVEGHSKASNVLTPHHLLHFALDPIFSRPLEVNPYFVAGLEMSRFLHDSGATREQCATVVVNNRANAMVNPSSGYAARLSPQDVLDSPPVAFPLARLDIAGSADGAIVAVMASEDVAKRITDKPVWIEGVGWHLASSYWTNRNLYYPKYVEYAARMAYSMA